ncbi:MAG: hypothetical protein WC752_00350 [Patescibacteria group bacterium]|jgi:hypothetical protein
MGIENRMNRAILKHPDAESSDVNNETTGPESTEPVGLSMDVSDLENQSNAKPLTENSSPTEKAPLINWNTEPIKQGDGGPMLSRESLIVYYQMRGGDGRSNFKISMETRGKSPDEEYVPIKLAMEILNANPYEDKPEWFMERIVNAWEEQKRSAGY